MNMQIFSSSLFYSLVAILEVKEQEFYSCTFNFKIMQCNIYMMFLAFS